MSTIWIIITLVALATMLALSVAAWRISASAKIRLLLVLSTMSAPALAMVLYANLGRADLPSAPFIQRQSQSWLEASAERRGLLPTNRDIAETAADRGLIESYEQHADSMPPSVGFLRTVAQSYMRLGNFRKAWTTLNKLTENQNEADNLLLMAEIAEAMILASGGEISNEAKALLQQILWLDPDYTPARYLNGLALVQKGKEKRGLAIWKSLAADMEGNAAFVRQLAKEIAAVEASISRSENAGQAEGE